MEDNTETLTITTIFLKDQNVSKYVQKEHTTYLGKQTQNNPDTHMKLTDSEKKDRLWSSKLKTKRL